MEESLRNLVDTETYPIDRIDSARAAELVARCREELDADALSTLPGFITPDTLEIMARESLELAPRAHRRDRLRTPYSWMDNRGFPADHPRAALTVMRQGTITQDMFDRESQLVALFGHRDLAEFVRRALGYDSLFTNADPYLALTVNVLNSGDEIGWHFDANEIVVGIMLSEPESGGHYEYAPYVRRSTDEGYDDVAQVFDGRSDLIRRPNIAPGTLYFFKGHQSAHRVTQIGPGTRPRLSAILCYDSRPGQLFSEATRADVFNPSIEPFLGTEG